MKYEAILCAAPPSLNMRMRCVYQNTDAEAATKKCLHWESICIMFAFLHCSCLLERNKDPLFAAEDSISCTFPLRWSCYSCLHVWLLSVCLCVCQTPVLHPLLHIVSQLHTRREKGLSMRVCTTNVSSPFTLRVFFVFCFTKWPHSRWLMKQRYWKQWLWFFFSIQQPMQSVMQIDMKSDFLWRLFTMYSGILRKSWWIDNDTIYTVCKIVCRFVFSFLQIQMRVLPWSSHMFSSCWAYMSIMPLHIRQLSSLSVLTQSTLVVLSQAASNYGLKLVQLTGELIIAIKRWHSQSGCRGIVSEKRGVFVLESPDANV